MIPADNVVKSNCVGSAHLRISLGSVGFTVLGTPGVMKGFGVSVGLLNGEVNVAVPPQVRENPALFALL